MLGAPHVATPTQGGCSAEVDTPTNFKFKNWKVTEGQGTRVTKAMRVKRANEIATKLNDTSYGIELGRTLM